MNEERAMLIIGTITALALALFGMWILGVWPF